MAYNAYRSTYAREISRLEQAADEAVDRVNERVNLNIALLVATRSLIHANAETIRRETFRDFVNGLGLDGRFEGIKGIGYARLVDTKGSDDVAGEIFRNYDLEVEIRPETDQTFRAPVILFEPFDTNAKIELGFDAFSDNDRRSAMLRSVEEKLPAATGPVELVPDSEERDTGFIVYLPLQSTVVTQPVERETPLTGIKGFIFAPFKANELFQVALGRMPDRAFVVDVSVVNGDEKSLLYRSDDFETVARNSSNTVKRNLEVAGENWVFTIHERAGFRTGISYLTVYLLAAVSLFLAVALAASTRAQFKALASAQELNAVSAKTVAEKDLMLSEMKHRIKNSLARVLAIARQTVANSSSMDEFSESFSSRIQAMANAQDMLTRSGWQRANLRELLENELEQVFDNSFSRSNIEGPRVELNEKATQALGLTFHELATNAIKYGALSQNEGDLKISWKLDGTGRQKRLILDWVETFNGGAKPPDSSGFGTRLIDANIKGELGGSIDRIFSDDGMSVRIDVPVTGNA